MEKITIDVVDSMSGTELPGATISVNGSSVGMTDQNGVYTIENANESDQITVSYIGYSPYTINAGIIEGTAQVQLAKSSDTLPTVTVTPSPKSNSALLWILGGGLAVAMLSGNKKSVGASKKNKNLLIGAGVLGVGAVYLMTRPSSAVPPATVPSTSQMIANKAASTNPISSLLSNLSPTLKSLFGGSSTPAPGTPGSFTPVSVDTGNATSSDDISPSFDYDTVDPGSASSLDFSGAPGMSGIGDVSSYLPYILAGGALLLLTGKSKKKIGSTDFSSYIIPVGVVVGGYLVLSNLNLFGNSPTAKNNDQVASGSASSIATAIQNEIANGGFATYSPANYQSWANDIYTQLQTGTPDETQVIRDVTQANTLLDWLYIKQAFGTKSFNTGNWLSLCAFAKMNCTTLDLDSAMKASMSQSSIDQINNYFSSQNINYHV